MTGNACRRVGRTGRRLPCWRSSEPHRLLFDVAQPNRRRPEGSHSGTTVLPLARGLPTLDRPGTAGGDGDDHQAAAKRDAFEVPDAMAEPAGTSPRSGDGVGASAGGSSGSCRAWRSERCVLAPPRGLGGHRGAMRHDGCGIARCHGVARQGGPHRSATAADCHGDAEPHAPVRRRRGTGFRCRRRSSPQHDAPAVLGKDRGASRRGGQYPMQREPDRGRAGCHAMPWLSGLGQWRARQRKKKSPFADAEQMHAKHADWPESGMIVHGRHRTTGSEAPRRCGGPSPICVLGVHLPAFALHPCLLRSAPHPTATVPESDALANTPCTCAGCRSAGSHAAQRHGDSPGRTPCTNSRACRRCAVGPAGDRQHRRGAGTLCSNSSPWCRCTVRAGRGSTASTCWQNPLHQFIRLPPRRRSGRPEAGSFGAIGRTPCTNSGSHPTECYLAQQKTRRR